MKFYNREEELAYLKAKLQTKTKEFVYIGWRRRIWKTTLIKKSLEGKKYLYFFVWKIYKNELLKRFEEVLSQSLWLPLHFQDFFDFFKVLFQIWDKFDAIVFDEFQNFYYINKSVYSYIQQLWDDTKKSIKIFVTWSHYTLLSEIFEKYTNPLYWRKTGQIFLKEFDYKTQLNILTTEWSNTIKPIDFLTFYWIYWGVPYYIEFLVDRIFKERRSKDLQDVLIKAFFDKDNIFLNEWKDILIVEFWDKHLTYFSILAAISSWKHTRSEIADFIWINSDSLGVYLQTLKDFYDIIWVERSINASETSKKVRYYIKDKFLHFWFRYVYRKQNLIELNLINDLVSFVKADINTYLGYRFEDLVKEYLILNNWNNLICPFKFTKIGKYFDKKREIDIVCLDEASQKACFIELKLSYYKPEYQILENLKVKVKESGKFKSYKHYFVVLTLEKFFNLIMSWN